MSEHDEEALSDELPDEALKAAASKCWVQAANPFTIAFCSGLDTCPAHPLVGGLVSSAMTGPMPFRIVIER